MQNILVIDDDKDICTVLSNFLVKSSYTVACAYTGAEGIHLLRMNEYDLILCDFKLPDLTGIELLQKIKVLDAKVAVIIITGYSDVKTAVETFRYGANDYITKPLYPDELLASIKETISKINSSINSSKVTTNWSLRINDNMLMLLTITILLSVKVRSRRRCSAMLN